MSRGLGRVQRQLLEVLHTHAQGADPALGLTTAELARRVHPRRFYHDFPHFPQPNTAAELASVRRALGNLAGDKLVLKLGTWGGQENYWRIAM